MRGGASAPAAHHLLQRLLVRMLHDPALAARAVADPERVLEGLALDAAGRAFLVAELARIDPRALRLDPLRRRRVLKALTGEYRLSTPLLLHRHRRLAALEGFFESPLFHDTVMARGSLAPAFGEYLGSLDAAGGLLAALARYERRLVLCRRVAPASPGSDPATDGAVPLALAPGVAVERFELDLLAAVSAVEAYLFEVSLLPMALVCEDGPRLELEEAPAAEPLVLLFVPDGTQPHGARLTPLEPALDELLHHLAIGAPAERTRADLVGWLGSKGLGPRGAAALLDSLLSDGTLGGY